MSPWERPRYVDSAHTAVNVTHVDGSTVFSLWRERKLQCFSFSGGRRRVLAAAAALRRSRPPSPRRRNPAATTTTTAAAANCAAFLLLGARRSFHCQLGLTLGVLAVPTENFAGTFGWGDGERGERRYMAKTHDVSRLVSLAE